jgi:hypothetical protein
VAGELGQDRKWRERSGTIGVWYGRRFSPIDGAAASFPACEQRGGDLRAPAKPKEAATAACKEGSTVYEGVNAPAPVVGSPHAVPFLDLGKYGLSKETNMTGGPISSVRH